MSDNSQLKELIEWLQEQGYGAEEIDKILNQVRQYDVETMHDSIMDSIAEGKIDLTKIIEEALADE